jgi:cytoplasmic tRNA 2-thiolation protein 1
MAEMETSLRSNDEAEAHGIEKEIRLPTVPINCQRHDRDQSNTTGLPNGQVIEPNVHNASITKASAVLPLRPKREHVLGQKQTKNASMPKQRLGQCERCGYLSSQAMCKACVLLEGLNKARPRTEVEVNSGAG